jgi:hypothetical protein
MPVIFGRRSRKRNIRYKQGYCVSHLVENAFCLLKDFRRVAPFTTISSPTSSQP